LLYRCARIVPYPLIESLVRRPPMHVLRKTAFLFCLFALPLSAFAQSTLAGVVKDNSGAVLPGVTVEASSPALIERTRTAVTDAAGQYQMVNLRPGAYSLTFTLSGFKTVRRDGIDVSGGGAITINAELNVGGVTETIVVTGETPVVDIKSVQRQAVVDNKIINELPVSRSYGSILAAIPTMQGAGANSSASQNPSFFSTHGGPGNEGHVQIEGLNVGAAFNGGGVSGNAHDIANAQEMQISLSGGLGEAAATGPWIRSRRWAGSRRAPASGSTSTAASAASSSRGASSSATTSRRSTSGSPA